LSEVEASEAERRALLRLTTVSDEEETESRRIQEFRIQESLEGPSTPFNLAEEVRRYRSAAPLLAM
jgi:hypothetical protein